MDALCELPARGGAYDPVSQLKGTRSLEEIEPKKDHVATAILQAASFTLYRTLMNASGQSDVGEWTEARALRLIAYVAQELDIEKDDVLRIVAAEAESMFSTVTADRDEAKIDSFLKMVEAWQ